jgi:hypothetical protein
MRTPGLAKFCAWLEGTPLSQAIQDNSWVVPSVQTVHILAIAALMGSALLIGLRVAGVAWREQPLAQVRGRFRPVIWWALPVLLGTGMVMIIGEPARSLANPVFQLKMLLVVSAIIVTLLPSENRLLGALAVSLWIAVVFAGRWIAYY